MDLAGKKLIISGGAGFLGRDADVDAVCDALTEVVTGAARSSMHRRA